MTGSVISSNVGLLARRMTSVESFGTAARSSSICLGTISLEPCETPVMFPPGRERLCANPAATGSPTEVTMGMMRVSF